MLMKLRKLVKPRKRFYVAKAPSERRVISLRWRPDPTIYGYAWTEVLGPFRTFADACDAIGGER